MRRHALLVLLLTALAPLAWGRPIAAQTPAKPPAPPVIVLDTVKGPIEIELWPNEAPKSVEHVLALVRRNFYRGLRFHWVNSAVAQVGDPATRDVTKKDSWGSGGSGTKIGVEEFSKRKFTRGSVGLSHRDGAKNSDSQIFVSKAANPNLDGKYIMIGRVIRGLEVVDKLAVMDVLRNATVK